MFEIPFRVHCAGRVLAVTPIAQAVAGLRVSDEPYEIVGPVSDDCWRAFKKLVA